MDQLSLRFPGAILLSMLIAIVISIMPLPDAMRAWRPEWMALTIIHWAVLFPRQSSYFVVWLAGLMLDTLWQSPMGQHALGFVLVLYLSLRLGDRMMPRTLIQQFFLVIMVLGTYMLVNLWIMGLTNNRPQSWSYWLPLFSSLPAWVVWHYLLGKLHVANKIF